MPTTPNFSESAIFSEVSTPTAPDSGYLKVYAKSGALYSIANGASEKAYATSTDLSSYLPLAGGTLVGDLLFTDATYDIGKSGATRPRDGFFSRNITLGGKIESDLSSLGGQSVVISGDGTARGYIYFQNSSYGIGKVGGDLNIVGASALNLAVGGTISSPTIIGILTSSGLDLRNSTTAQTLRVYNTYTSSTSFENLQFKAVAGDAYQIGSAIGSAGGTNRDLSFGQWNSAGTFSNLLNISGASGGSTVRIATTSGAGTCGLEFGSTLSGWQMGQIKVSYDSLGGWGTGFDFVINKGGGPGDLITPFSISSRGRFVFTQLADASGSPTAFTLTGGAHTTLTASTEATDVNFNLARTVQFANGDITTQRAFRIQAPVYSHVSGSNTIATASTLSVSGPPTTTGGFTTITNAYALDVEGGKSRFGGEINLTNASSQTLRIAMDTNNPVFSSATTRVIMSGTAVWLRTDGGVLFNNSSDSEMGRVSISSFNLTLQSNTNGSLTLTVPTSANSNQGGNSVSVIGQTALSSSTNVLHGGSVNITGGNGASASAGNAYGGDIVLTPGTGYGSGRQGVVSILGPITNTSTGITEIRYGTTAQEFRIYTTYTSATSYERIEIKGKAGANFEIGPENGSAGGTLRGLTIGGYSAGSSTITPWLTFDNAGNITASASAAPATSNQFHSYYTRFSSNGGSLTAISIGNSNSNIRWHMWSAGGSGHLSTTSGEFGIGYSTEASTTATTQALKFSTSGSATFASNVVVSGTTDSTGNVTTNGLFSSDRYAVSANYRFRRANGTSGSPTQVTSGQAVGALSSFGYHDGGAFHSSAGALVYFVAAENFTSTAHGTNIQFWTTPTTSTTSAKRVTIEASGELTLEAGSHIQTSGAGVKIGTATSQKLGFWNATPVVQQTTASTSATVVGGGGTTVTQTDTFDGYTLAQIVKALRTIGILA